MQSSVQIYKFPSLEGEGAFVLWERFCASGHGYRRSTTEVTLFQWGSKPTSDLVSSVEQTDQML